MENLDKNNETTLKLFIKLLDKAEDYQLREIINYYKECILSKQDNTYAVTSKKNRDDTKAIMSKL
jgi:hypothetical protein